MPKREHMAFGDKKNHVSLPEKRPRKRKKLSQLNQTFLQKRELRDTPRDMLVKEYILWAGDVLDLRTMDQFIQDTPGASATEVTKISRMPTVTKQVADRLRESLEASKPLVLKSMMRSIQKGRFNGKDATQYLEAAGLHIPQKRVRQEIVEDIKELSDQELLEEIKKQDGSLQHANEGYTWKDKKPEVEA